MDSREPGPARGQGKLGTVGIKDVAQHAGVSVTTVSNVLNSTNRISERTRERVRASIDALGYVRNAAAHQLRAGNTTTIGLIVPDGANPYYSAIARGAEDVAFERGGSVLVGNSNNSIEREQRYVELFSEHRIPGLLIAPVSGASDRIEGLLKRGIRPVVVGRAALPERCSSVSIDNTAGGYVATKHLLDSGRSRLLFAGPVNTPGVRDRLAGARLAIQEAEGAELEVVDLPSTTVEDGRTAGAMVAARPAGRRPDGVFCANDLVATGMLHAFIESRAVRVPDDIALIGYDDIDFAASAIVPLSSIHQPASLIGRTAAELLAEELEDPDRPHRNVLFPPELVVRESTSPVS